MQPSVNSVLAQIQEARQVPTWTTLDELWVHLRKHFPTLASATYDAALHRALSPRFTPSLDTLHVPSLDPVTRVLTRTTYGVGLALVSLSLLAPLAVQRWGSADPRIQALAVGAIMLLGVGVMVCSERLLYRWFHQAVEHFRPIDTLTLLGWQQQHPRNLRARLLLDHLLTQRLGRVQQRRLAHQVAFSHPLVATVR